MAARTEGTAPPKQPSGTNSNGDPVGGGSYSPPPARTPFVGDTGGGATNYGGLPAYNGGATTTYKAPYYTGNPWVLNQGEYFSPGTIQPGGSGGSGQSGWRSAADLANRDRNPRSSV